MGNVTSGNVTVTFLPPASFATPATVPSTQITTNQTGTVTAAVTIPTAQATVQPTATVLPKKTTFTPLPDGLAIAAFGIAACALAAGRKY